MIISHKHKFIYLKLPKVAGTSVEYFLERFCGEDDIITPIFPVESKSHTPRNYQKYNLENHSLLNELFSKIPYQSLKDYRIIANERNSWDRVASMYSMEIYRNETNKEFVDWVKSSRISQIYLKSKYQGRDIITDWIRYDHLQSDLIRFCESLKIDFNDSSLLHTKNYRTKHYTEYYNDEAKQIVAERYVKDIEYFGYQFGE